MKPAADCSGRGHCRQLDPGYIRRTALWRSAIDIDSDRDDSMTPVLMSQFYCGALILEFGASSAHTVITLAAQKNIKLGIAKRLRDFWRAQSFTNPMLYKRSPLRVLLNLLAQMKGGLADGFSLVNEAIHLSGRAICP
jgi:hypothetical protein